MAIGADVTAICRAKPTGLLGFFHIAFEPGPTIRDAATIALLTAGRAAKLDRSQALRVTDVAKNKGSDAHIARDAA